jgi:hypothetical protein
MARVGADRNSAAATDASGVRRGRRTCAVAAADIDIAKDAMVVVRGRFSPPHTTMAARRMRLCLTGAKESCRLESTDFSDTRRL